MFSFPETEEVQLKHPPLAEVICQVRFPTILRIAREMPAEFQEHIQDEFPLVDQELVPSIPAGTPPTDDEQDIKWLPVYHFSTIDKQTKISLSHNFFAVSAKNYKHWDEFKLHIATACQAVTNEFKVLITTRIGLRFVNQIQVGDPGIASISDLIAVFRTDLTNLLHNETLGTPGEMLTRLLLEGTENHILTLRLGFKQNADAALMLLDLDRYNQSNLDINEVQPTLEQFHQDIHNAFRWCIPDEKLNLFNLES